MNALSIAGPVIRARFVEKRNRFVAVADTGAGLVDAHVPTSSRMRELLTPGAEVLLVARAGEKRVTGYDLIMAQHGRMLVSVDSRVPNRLLDVVLRGGSLPEFAGWDFARGEVPLGASRIDFLLTRGDQRCWIEAKSVTLVENGVALFPDAPTLRGARHLEELAAARANGDRAVAVFIIQRDDADRFSPHCALDPHFTATLADAAAQGVEIYAYTCAITPERIAIAGRVEVDYTGSSTVGSAPGGQIPKISHTVSSRSAASSLPA